MLMDIYNQEVVIMGKCKHLRLKAPALAISLGVVSGVSLMFVAWAVLWWGVGTPLIQQWSGFYPGFDATIKGGLIGLAWGFLHGFVVGLVIAWIYNLCVCCSRCPSCSSCCPKHGASCNDPSCKQGESFNKPTL
jgi:hypothetical protein